MPDIRTKAIAGGRARRRKSYLQMFEVDDCPTVSEMWSAAWAEDDAKCQSRSGPDT